MTEHQWLDLKGLVEEMYHEPLVRPEDLVAWGGAIPAGDLARFLAAWALPREGMPWSLWQWTDRIEVQYGQATPSDLEYLERGRVLGPEGDLEIRRERDGFLWRYIGDRAAVMPQGFEAADYWQGRGSQLLRPYRRTALLWGSRRAAKQHGKPGWHDDRVSQANLNYPRLSSDRAQISYIEYLDAGNVEWVRLTGLQNRADGPEGGENA